MTTKRRDSSITEPPTKFEKAVDDGTRWALNILIFMLAAFNFYASTTLYEEYVVVPDNVQPHAWISEQQSKPSFMQSYDPTLPVMQQSAYDAMINDRHSWMTKINFFGIAGIIVYLGLRLSQGWYRKRLASKYKNLLEKGRVSDQN